VPEIFESRAYADEALPLGHGQTISRPSTHALYLQALNLRGEEKVLEIGTGSGFQTALLATLCRQVLSIELVPGLATAARKRIDALGLTNVVIRAGDGSIGWRSQAPFDAILVTAGAAKVPQPLLDQLAPGGQLLIPIGDSRSQELHRIVRSVDGTLQDEILAHVRFVAFQGQDAREGGREDGDGGGGGGGGGEEILRC
jgi:protein-L-isoaspartate(D-aspartate) O-methyltransferase